MSQPDGFQSDLQNDFDWQPQHQGDSPQNDFDWLLGTVREPADEENGASYNNSNEWVIPSSSQEWEADVMPMGGHEIQNTQVNQAAHLDNTQLVQSPLGTPNVNMSQPIDFNQSDSFSNILSDGTITFSQTEAESLMADLGCGGAPDSNEEVFPNSSQVLTAAAPALVMPIGGHEIQNLQVSQAHLEVMDNSQRVEPFPQGAPSPVCPYDDAPSSQRQVSSDDDIPVISPFRGPYGFRCNVVGGQTTNRSYSEKLNKLFVNMESETEVQFFCDFEKVKGSKMHVETFLRYKDASAAHFVVERCTYHTDKDKNAMLGATDDKKKALIPHVIQCKHAEAEYFGEKGSRYRVRVPLDGQQPGVNYISRNFRFYCLTSCKNDIPQTKQMVVVFELKIGEETQGRATINVKVCTNPKRDCIKAEKRDSTNEEVNALEKTERRTTKRERTGASTSAPGTSGCHSAMNDAGVVKKAKVEARTTTRGDSRVSYTTGGGAAVDNLLSSSPEIVLCDDATPSENKSFERNYRMYMHMTRYVLYLKSRGSVLNQSQRDVVERLETEIARAYSICKVVPEMAQLRWDPWQGVSAGACPNPDD